MERNWTGRERESVPSRHEAVGEEKSEVAAGKALEPPDV